MRRILVDYARARVAEYREDGIPLIPLERIEEVDVGGSRSLIGLDDALVSLEKMDARKSKIVELRVFGGMTNEETVPNQGLRRSMLNYLLWVHARIPLPKCLQQFVFQHLRPHL